MESLEITQNSTINQLEILPRNQDIQMAVDDECMVGKSMDVSLEKSRPAGCGRQG